MKTISLFALAFTFATVINAQDAADFPVLNPKNHLSTNLYLNGSFIEKNTAEKMQNAQIQGLFINENGKTYIADANLIYNASSNPWEFMEDSNMDSGFIVESKNHDYCLMLLSNSHFSNKNIDTIGIERLSSAEGFFYNKTHYKLESWTEFEDVNEAYNYSLVLTVTENGHSQQQTLIHRQHLQEAYPSVLLAGDMDSDGKLDFLLDSTDNFGVFMPTLYLSKPAAKGDLVKVVAVEGFNAF